MKLIKNKKYMAIHILAIFVIIVFFNSYAAASVSTYPTEEWQISTPEEQGMHSQRLVEMMEHVKKNNFSIDSILIVRNGYVVLDAYFYPFLKGQEHIIHSCTKSIMSALIGIAIDKGYIQSVDQPITDFFPNKAFANADDLKKSIRLENLLMMASGLKCRDSSLYGFEGFWEMRNSNDWAQYVLDLPMEVAPGEKFEYCNGVSYLLSVIIQNTTKMETLDFARKHLFEPLGIIDIEWERSPQGIDAGYGGMWLKPHDMAKFGWLYLNKGAMGNKQIVPSAWVEVSTRGHIGATLFDQYGYQWWVDSAGFYMAVGYGGQFIFVIPNKNMVVVFTGIHVGHDFFRANTLLKNYIIPAATSSVPLPENSDKYQQLSSTLNEMASSNSAKPVPSLPELAIKISGKTYNFEENVLGLKSLTFNFNKKSDVMYIDWHGIRDIVYPLIVGLDDVYRIQGPDVVRWARKGAWIRKDTFLLYYQSVGNTIKGVATMVFKNDKVSAEFKSTDDVIISLRGVYSKE